MHAMQTNVSWKREHFSVNNQLILLIMCDIIDARIIYPYLKCNRRVTISPDGRNAIVLQEGRYNRREKYLSIFEMQLSRHHFVRIYGMNKSYPRYVQKGGEAG